MPLNYKLVVFGDGTVGKTTLINRYVSGSFNEFTQITIGVEFHVKRLQVMDEAVVLQIWDFGGEERFRFMLPAYCRGAKGGIFIYDITSPASLFHFTDWMEVIRNCSKEMPIIIAGTKCDLQEEQNVFLEDAQLKGKGLNVTNVMEVSAKTGQNVELLFQTLACLMMQQDCAITPPCKNHESEYLMKN